MITIAGAVVESTTRTSYTPTESCQISARSSLVEGVFSGLEDLDGCGMIVADQDSDVFLCAGVNRDMNEMRPLLTQASKVD